MQNQATMTREYVIQMQNIDIGWLCVTAGKLGRRNLEWLLPEIYVVPC